MTIEAIKTAIEGLTDPEVKVVTNWLEERAEAALDRKMCEDFAPGGQAQILFDELSREIDDGKTLSMEDGCRQHKLNGSREI